ncbi:MAG: GIY-YIG nuclease family protein [Candidatus Roizmanbacteria bacterium]
MPPQKQYFTYILASKYNGTLYIGVTNDLLRRVSEHRKGNVSEFTARYKVYTLVHVEIYSDICDALARERQLKNWKREWKMNLISQSNPQWNDLINDFAKIY